MTNKQIDRIIKRHVAISLKERGLRKIDVDGKQYRKELYQMALKLLLELK